jgi:hypothetical protein
MDEPNIGQRPGTFPEMDLTTEKTNGLVRQRLTGKADYTIGWHSVNQIDGREPSRELHIVTIEAKALLLPSHYVQCIAEMAALYTLRVKAGKSNPKVWGILSNAETWVFFHIDNDGKLWESSKYLVPLDKYGDSEVNQVYQIIHHIMKMCLETCTPTQSPTTP